MACSTSERKITGIDPSRELIQQAKQRDTDNRINWVVASRFDDLPDASVDIVLLSGHVAQFLTDEESWQRFLA